MYPSLEVTKSNIIKDIFIPYGIRFTTWVVSNGEATKVGYALYPKNKSSPIILGYFTTTSKNLVSDKAILDILGNIFYSTWDNLSINFSRLSSEDFTDNQIKWLESGEADPIFDILDNYEEDGFSDSSIYDNEFVWLNERLCTVCDKKPLFKEINLN